jgi:hypothetical protein
VGGCRAEEALTELREAERAGLIPAAESARLIGLARETLGLPRLVTLGKKD